MLATATALLSLAAVVAANLPGSPPDEDITVTVGPGSSFAGYQLAGFVDGGAAFPELVAAGDASQAWHLVFQDYGHFSWYSLFADVAGGSYGLEVDSPDNSYTGLMTLVPSTTYGTNIWGAKTDSPNLVWTGDSRASTYACAAEDGHVRLGIYFTGKQPAECESVQLEYQAVA